MSRGSTTGARRDGEASAAWRSDGVLLVMLRGHQDGARIGELVEHCRARLAERRPRSVLFDATGIDSFAPDVRQTGVMLLQLFRSADVPRGVAAVSSGAVRMMAAAISFAAGLPLDMCESRVAAERRIDELLRTTT